MTDTLRLAVWKFTTVTTDSTIRYPTMRIVDSATAADQHIGWSYDQSENYFYMTRSSTHANAQFQSNPTRYYDTAFAFDEKGDTFGEGNSGDITAGSGSISNWSSACFFSNQPGSGASTYTGGYDGGTYASRFASLSSDGSVANTNSNRVQNPDMIAALTTVTSTIGASNKATIYLSYYDAVLNAVQLRVGTVGPTSTIGGALADKGTSSRSPWDTAGAITIAGASSTKATAGQYSAIALNPLDRSTLVAVWYESSTKKLWYSYNTQPSVAAQSTQWQSHAVCIDSDFAGSHCDVAMDAGGGVHIAYFRSSTGDLCYTNFAAYNTDLAANPPTLVTVDSYLSVGEYLRIGTLSDGTNYVPSISYYSGTFASTSASVKVAYRKTFSSLQAGASLDKFTGDWEVMTLPCANNPKAYKVSLGYKEFESGSRSTVLGYATDSTLEYAYKK